MLELSPSAGGRTKQPPVGIPPAPSTLGGPQKTAVILMAVGEDRAASLMGKMTDEELREVSHAMAELGAVQASVVEQLFLQFAQCISGTGTLVGSYDSTERLLRRTLPSDRVEDIMEEIRGPAGRTLWEKLSNVNETTLASFLKNEYPQTIAVVISRLKPENAARVMGQLPEQLAHQVAQRMLQAEPVRKEVLASVENTLRTEFMANLTRSSSRDRHEVMAEIFNGFDRGTESRFMTALREWNPEAAGKVKALMFTFDDLRVLDPASIQKLIGVADKRKLTLALKGTSDEVRDFFFSNMSERAGRMMRDDMAAMGPVRMREVDEAQGEIVVQAKDLAEKGEIVIPKDGTDSEMVF